VPRHGTSQQKQSKEQEKTQEHKKIFCQGQTRKQHIENIKEIFNEF